MSAERVLTLSGRTDFDIIYKRVCLSIDCTTAQARGVQSFGGLSSVQWRLLVDLDVYDPPSLRAYQ
jgi:hypothetical protein